MVTPGLSSWMQIPVPGSSRSSLGLVPGVISYTLGSISRYKDWSTVVEVPSGWVNEMDGVR